MGLEPLTLLDQVDERWLERVLFHHYKSVITVQKLYRYSKEKDGFLSEIEFFDVITKEKGILSICVKLLPQDTEFRKLVSDGDLARKEALFYEFFGCSQVKKMIENSSIFPNIPEVFYCGYTPEKFTMVMRNMSYGDQGFKNPCAFDGADLQLTVKAIEAISIVHAISSVYIEVNGLGMLEKLAECSNLNEALKPFCKTGIELMSKKTTCQQLKNILSELLSSDKYLNLFEVREKNLPQSLLHGDYWIGQILQDPKSKQVCILDWQFVAIGSPASDIVMFLLMSSLPYVFEQHLDDVLQAYIDSYNYAVTMLNSQLSITMEDMKKEINKSWNSGALLLLASLETLVSAQKIPLTRAEQYVKFAHKVGAFD